MEVLVICEVRLTKLVQKQIGRLPQHIVQHLLAWVEDVELNGIEHVRLRSGYHDEPLKGSRKGQRSIRLSRSYRAIYEICGGGVVEFICVEEVTKHDY